MPTIVEYIGSVTCIRMRRNNFCLLNIIYITLHIYSSWYFGKVSRVETQKLLMGDVNDQGSFLIRESESVPNTYALSLRDANMVRHYKIKRLDNGGYFISKNHEFENLQGLVAFYLQEAEGLCCRLIAPCKKVSLLSFLSLWFFQPD